MRERIKKTAVDVLVDIIAGTVLAIAFYSFALPADFPMTGVSGVALIIYQLTGFPVGMMTVFLNIPIVIFCYRSLGKQLYLNSVRSTLITSLMMDLIGPLLPAYEGERILAALCAGVLCGFGYAIVFMRGSSTGGFDFIMMAMHKKWPHLSLGVIGFITDGAVLLGGSIMIGSMDALIYGIIRNYLYSIILDSILNGTHSGKMMMIVTDFPEKMVEMIDKTADRGATILKGTGGYSGEDKPVVLCASSNKEMYAIRQRVHELDEKAFVIIVDSNEVVGEGFQLPGETTVV